MGIIISGRLEYTSHMMLELILITALVCWDADGFQRGVPAPQIGDDIDREGDAPDCKTDIVCSIAPPLLRTVIVPILDAELGLGSTVIVKLPLFLPSRTEGWRSQSELLDHADQPTLEVTVIVLVLSAESGFQPRGDTVRRSADRPA